MSAAHAADEIDAMYAELFDPNNPHPALARLGGSLRGGVAQGAVPNSATAVPIMAPKALPVAANPKAPVKISRVKLVDITESKAVPLEEDTLLEEILPAELLPGELLSEEVLVEESTTTSSPVTPLVAVFFAHGIRIKGTVDEPLFVATDVAKHIEDINNSRVFRKKMTECYIQMGTACNARGQRRQVHLLTEAGLYRYLLQSKKKLAEEFQLFTYNLLTAERKRTVDDARLALKINKTQRMALQWEISVNRAVLRDGKIKVNDNMRIANIARDQHRRNTKGLKIYWRRDTGAEESESDGDGEGDSEDEYEMASDDDTTIETNILPTKPKKIPLDKPDGTSEIERMTPLVALFYTRDIKILGTVCEPLLCAADVAKYIKDKHSTRIFLNQTPDSYIRWIMVKDAQGQTRRTRYLTEAGTYRYLLRSTLPGAEAFQTFTYDLLKTERKNTVDSIQLAIKIEKTRIEELEREKLSIQASAHYMMNEMDRSFQAVNDARYTTAKSKAHLKELREKDEKDQIRKYWSPFPPPKQ